MYVLVAKILVDLEGAELESGKESGGARKRQRVGRS